MQLDAGRGPAGRDQALLANAQVDLQRYRKLWAQDSIPKQQLDTQEALVRQYEAAIETDQGQVDAAKLQLTYSRITAPVSGRLGLRLVDPGNMVHASDAGGLVVDHADPADRRRLHDPRGRPAGRAGAARSGGEPPAVEAYDREGTRRLATGTLLTIDNAIDPTTGTVRLKAQFPNDDDALFPNQFVNARLLLDVRRGATLVPGVAMQRGTQGTFVYVVTPDADGRRCGRCASASARATTPSIDDGRRAGRAGRRRRRRRAARRHAGDARRRRAAPRPSRATREPVPPVHPPAGRHHAADGGDPAGRRARRTGKLPVSALPQVDYPTIQVATFYPGASPDVMASSVTAPLERQFGQMPGLSQMTSTSSGGSSLITLQFALDLSLDVAEQEVQAAINAATSFLPRDLPTPPVYSKVNPADAPILTLALTSETLPLPQVEDLAETRLVQKIAELPGVGLVSISGGQRPAVRIRANPTALAAYGLTLEDAARGHRRGQRQPGEGRASTARARPTPSAPTTSCCRAPSTSRSIVAYRNGAPVRLSDVADVVDDAENVEQAAWMNETPAVIVNIQRQPGANVIEVVDRVRALLPQLEATLPPSVHVTVLTDRTTTIRASVEDVQFELVLSVVLVVLVIFLFLRSLAGTVIPAVAVPLSLVGTFGVMYLLGFSLNNLSLMALTISTGFVVDDAIVMIENIARYVERGDAPLEAALKGAAEIGFTILSLTVSLVAVLIPLLFMGDVVGRLFREFAITLGVTILISAVVSLTLTPMMCARLLRHTPPEQQGRFYRASERLFERIIDGYGRTLRWVLGAPARDAAGRRRGARAHRRALRRRAQGLLPGAGHRRSSSASPRRRRRSRSRPWPSGSRRWRR